MNNLISILPSDESDINRLLESWISENEKIVCISVWIENKRWPIRVVQSSFLENEMVTQMSEDDRQNLYNYIFQDESALNQVNQPSFLGPIFDHQIFGFPIISIGLSSLNLDPIEIIEAKIKLDDIPDLLQTILQDGESVALLDSDENIMVTLNKISKSNNVTDENNVDLLFSYFDHLPWRLQLERTRIIQSKPIPFLKTDLFIVLALGIPLIILAGLLLSRWIDKPFIQLIETVTEVARGKFENQIPPSNNHNLNRLVKIFNYMAEEMYNLQKIDIGEIVNEKNKTETILRNIADGVVVTDSQDRILVINSVAEKWFGLNEKEVLQKPIQKHIQNQHLIALLQEVKDGQAQSSAEFSFSIVQEHEKKIFQANAARIQNQEDKLVGVVTVIRDVTKVKEADQIKTELVSMVAHELKSPLTSIYGFSELLLDAKLKDPKAEEYAKVILAESTRLTDLINKFLDISRLEAGRTEIRLNPFNLKQVVNKIVDIYKGQAEKKQIRVIQEIPERLSPALGDQDMIEQVLLNLFSNAIKYSPPRSKIGIEVKEQDDTILVNVVDNGYGIPEEALPKIFNKFYRVTDLEGSDEVEGSGLGLSLSKEIIERHGGTINVSSRFGVGSVFSFTLQKADVI
ncbi:PAS domain-containing protein [bacterium]|nr:PAS domain-containing protein [bacterium]